MYPTFPTLLRFYMGDPIDVAVDKYFGYSAWPKEFSYTTYI